MSWEWSNELQLQLDQLTAQQQRAILLIVMAESKGHPATRLFKTPYSCQWCGLVIGQTADGRDKRKAALIIHESSCQLDNSRPWQFAASRVTFYTRWKLPGSLFEKALTQARREVRENALQRAAWILQMGAPEAAIELRRQVAEAKDESDRRLASVAILDRADLSTAGKTSVNVNIADLTDEQLQRIAAGDDPAAVLGTSTKGGG